MATRTKLAVILHADVVGSTRLVQLDERVAHERIQEAFSQFARTIESYGGTAHEVRGDALVAEFERASDAVSAALAFQAENAARYLPITDGLQPTIRVGISLGEVVVADNTLTGAGVVLAQRLEQLAKPGGLCISAAIREALPARLPFVYDVLGEHKVKGFDEPVRVFGVEVIASTAVPEPDPYPSTPESARSRRRIALVVATLLIALVGLATWLALSPRFALNPEAVAARDELSIAVLPFSNRSDDKAQDYFSDGISEDINTDLTKVPGLAVTPAATMHRYQGEQVDMRDVSDEVGARYILQGSVRRGTDRLRISAQLYDVEADKQIWAERYDRDIGDLFAVQDDISEKVVTAISAKLTAGALTRQVRTYTPNVEAYDLYIHGRATRIPPTPSNLASASALFEKAIEIDPQFAGGYAGASFTNVLRYGECSKACDELLDTALVLANKAVSLDPTFGPGHGSLAEVRFRRGELDAALSAIQKAVEVTPNDSLMRASYGRILGHIGRYEEGVQQVKQALRMSPDSLPLLYYLGSIYRVAGRFDEAIEALVEHRKRLGGRVLPAPSAQLAAAYLQSGRELKARTEVAQLRKVAPNFSLEQASRAHGFDSKEASEAFLDALREAGLPVN